MRALPRLAPLVGGRDSGPWVTFIPGIGNDAQFWQAHADAVAGTHRTLRFDPWGCGASGPPPPDCTVEAVAEGIVALWDELGIERSSVVGLGFGGSTALALAIHASDRVDRVVACCCRARQPDDRRQFWRDRAAAARVDGLEPLAMTTIERWLSPALRAERPELADELTRGFLNGSVDGYCAHAEAFSVMDLAAGIGSIGVPVLLIAAEHDHGGGPVEDMRDLAGEIPGSRFAVVAGSGHIVNHERPDEVSALLRGFLVG